MSSPDTRSKPYHRNGSRMTRVRSFVRRRIRRSPIIEGLAIRLWVNAAKTKWKLATFFDNVKYGEVGADRTHWVSPKSITYSAMKEFSLYGFKDRVIGGDWDRLEKKFEDLDVYLAFKEVCIDGKSWSQTIFYKRILARIEGGEILWNCRSKGDLDERFRALGVLYQQIMHDGYKSQSELGQAYSIGMPDDEVTVSIGRHGDLLFSNCAHRLSIANLLGIEKVPVKVAVRHIGWMEFKRELLLYAEEQGGKLYQPCTHLDFKDIPASHDCVDRYELIRNRVSVKKGRLLDIGANTGYFCHRFEDEGFDCYAVEMSLKALYFLRKLKRAENKRFKVIGESVLDCREIRDLQFEVVLALNIFHHFLKTRETYDLLLDLLAGLQMKELFFEPHLPSEPQMKDAYKNFTPDEFVQFISHNSKLEKVELVGEAKDGRQVYRLY